MEENTKLYKCERRRNVKSRNHLEAPRHIKEFTHNSHWRQHEEEIDEKDEKIKTERVFDASRLENKVIELKELKNACEQINIQLKPFWSTNNDFMLKYVQKQTNRSGEVQLYLSEIVDMLRVIDVSEQHSAIQLEIQLKGFPVEQIGSKEMSIGERFIVILFKSDNRVYFFHGGCQAQFSTGKIVKKLLRGPNIHKSRLYVTFTVTPTKLPAELPIYKELVRGKVPVIKDPFQSWNIFEKKQEKYRTWMKVNNTEDTKWRKVNAPRLL